MTFCPPYLVSFEEVGDIRTSQAERKSEIFQALPYKNTAVTEGRLPARAHLTFLEFLRGRAESSQKHHCFPSPRPQTERCD